MKRLILIVIFVFGSALLSHAQVPWGNENEHPTCVKYCGGSSDDDHHHSTHDSDNDNSDSQADREARGAARANFQRWKQAKALNKKALKEKDMCKAAEEFKQVASYFYNWSVVYYNIGFSTWKCGDHAASIEYFQKAQMYSNPNSEDYKDAQDFITSYQNAQQRGVREEAAFQEGRKACSAGEWATCEQKNRECLSYDTSAFGCYYNLSIALWGEERMEDALIAAENAYAKNPTDKFLERVNFLKGLVQYRKDRAAQEAWDAAHPEEAKKRYEQEKHQIRAKDGQAVLDRNFSPEQTVRLMEINYGSAPDTDPDKKHFLQAAYARLAPTLTVQQAEDATEKALNEKNYNSAEVYALRAALENGSATNLFNLVKSMILTGDYADAVAAAQVAQQHYPNLRTTDGELYFSSVIQTWTKYSNSPGSNPKRFNVDDLAQRIKDCDANHMFDKDRCRVAPVDLGSFQ